MTTTGLSFIQWSCRCVALALAVVALLGLPLAAAGPRFFPDDPIAQEPDPADASKVQPFPIHLTWDLISSLFVKQGNPVWGRAQNVNTIDEVPDSSWFTNRAGSRALRQPMSPAVPTLRTDRPVPGPSSRESRKG